MTEFKIQIVEKGKEPKGIVASWDQIGQLFMSERPIAMMAIEHMMETMLEIPHRVQIEEQGQNN